MERRYHTLGRSGLRISRLALGTMTFGAKGWGCDMVTARSILNRYLASGGNFIDTADIYGGGESEIFLGAYIAEEKIRDQVVLATKYTLNSSNAGDNPNAAGNGRKNLIRAIEGSLKRLQTDYVDMLYVHAWDGVTPVEEVMRGLDDLVGAGKVRYIGLSDVPAWYASRAQTLAEWRGFERICAIQMEYSLLQRGVELEFGHMCQALGVDLVAWSPLASGMLSGKYRPGVEIEQQSEGRLKATAKIAMQSNSKMTRHNWSIVAELERVAKEVGRSMAQVAINWTANRPAVGSVLLGARHLGQLEETLSSLEFCLPPELVECLDRASALPPLFPYAFMAGIQSRLYGSSLVEANSPNYSDVPAPNYLLPEQY